MIIDSLGIDPVEMNTKISEWIVINDVKDSIIQSYKKEIRIPISLAYHISIVAKLACKAIIIYAMEDLPQRINAYKDLLNLDFFL